MPLAKRDPTIIKHPFFQGTEELVIEDIVSLSVEGFGLSAEPLLSNLNWSRGVFALSGLKLAPDNLRVLSSSMFLLGSVFSHKKLNASNFWNFTAPTTQPLGERAPLRKRSASYGNPVSWCMPPNTLDISTPLRS